MALSGCHILREAETAVTFQQVIRQCVRLVGWQESLRLFEDERAGMWMIQAGQRRQIGDVVWHVDVDTLAIFWWQLCKRVVLS